MKRLVPVLVAIAAVLVSGVVHGFWTGRWEVFQTSAKQAADRLPSIAENVGDWHGETPESHLRPDPEVAGQLYRRYVRHTDNATVTLFMVCGRPGPVSVHTPDVCYSASGFEVSTLGKHTYAAGPSGQKAEFDVAQMVRTRAAQQTRLRIFWSWNAGDGWVVPDHDPRWAFARQPALYKLYLIRELTGQHEPLDEDPTLDLMRQLLPEIQKSLFSRS